MAYSETELEPLVSVFVMAIGDVLKRTHLGLATCVTL